MRENGIIEEVEKVERYSFSKICISIFTYSLNMRAFLGWGVSLRIKIHKLQIVL